jgi:nitroreductase
MELKEAVKGRRSIRCFKDNEVPQAMISEIVEQARWAPSWGNTQPCELFILTGDPLKRFKEANRRHVTENVPTSSEIPMPEQWPTVLKNRYMGVGKQVLSSQGIGREDKDLRNRYYADMFSLFNAPCLIVTCIPRSLSVEYAMLDAGLLNQTLCLLAHGRGLGTIMLAAAVRHPGVLRSVAPIPKDRRIVIGTALGYPDLDAPINQFERERAPLDEVAIWVG